MFDQADSEEWVRCPECRNYFQVKHASPREIPQLVMTKDEALLAEEESESAKETVDSALETRWETRRTYTTASTQTVVGSESTSANVVADEGHDSELDPVPAENVKDAAKRTISDLSTLATWSDLPVDQIEAQVRAELAGDAPVRSPAASETPTLRLRRAPDEDEAPVTESPKPPDDSGDRFDKWFQAKQTVYNFMPPTSDESQNDSSVTVPPLNDAAASLNDEGEERSFAESDAAVGDESSSTDEQPESAAVMIEREDPSADRPPAWPQGRPIPHWARQSRRSSPLRMFAMIGFGGVFGLALGYYALLWIAGPRGDFLNARRHLPSAILPREFRAPVVTAPETDSLASETPQAPDLVDSDQELVEAEPITSTPGTGEIETGAAPEAAGIVGAPSFSVDELAVALSKAKEAQHGLVAGNFDDGAEVKRTKGHSYMSFCDLAQTATLVDKKSNVTDAATLEEEVLELVQATFAGDHVLEEVAQMVPAWIKSAKRTHGGIFLAGRATNQADKGSVVECQLDLGSGQSVIVLVPQERIESIESMARPLAVLGWIVDRPSENVRGYTGDAAQAVWAGHIAPLE
jgi:hypothetical protein